MNNNKSVFFAVLSAVALVAAGGFTSSAATAIAQTQQTTTTTTTTSVNTWNHGHWKWREGFEHPNGIFQGNNFVVIPSQTLAQTVINTCPSYAPVLLSTGQCLTTAQALYELQTGQLTLGGQVQSYGTVIIGQPTVIAATGYTDPFQFFHHFHHDIEGNFTR